MIKYNNIYKKIDRNLKVAFFHNIISPYRVPLFEALSKKINLTVYFGKITRKDRMWKVTENLKFKHEILLNFGVLPMLFTINPDLPLKLFIRNYDIFIGADSDLLSTQITFLISKICQKPFILWTVERDYSWKKIYPWWKDLIKIIKTISKIIALHSDACVVPGEEAKKRLLRLGVTADRIFIGSNAIPIKPFRKKFKEANAELLKKELGIDRKTKIILSLSYLRELKGIQYLIKAFKKLENERKDVLLIIAGDGPYLNELMKIQKNNNVKNIIYIGYVPNEITPTYYKMADIFVLPSLRDSWGITINEAMICEKPIITTFDTGAMELVKDNGFIVSSYDENMLYEAMKILLQNNLLAKEKGKKSWEYIKEYSIERELKGFLEAIIYVNLKNLKKN